LSGHILRHGPDLPEQNAPPGRAGHSALKEPSQSRWETPLDPPRIYTW
jgi:hypothetical protein